MARTAAPGSRERILDTAAGLFYRYGVRAVGMKQVIDAAGCGKNLLYTHFPSKNDLVAAYLRECRRERARSAAAAAGEVPGDDPAAQLLALVGEIVTTVGRPEFRGCAFRIYLTEFPDDQSEPARLARDYLRDSRAEIDRLVARLGVTDPGQLADRVWLIVEGLYASAARSESAGAADAATQLVRDLLAGARER
ncbi:TetR/AcrR family transcriptional regulator [Micromonospora inositola]|uniref:Transcriptional regulator, TetR family n=1 Tax=Micromonospora inositola TaxID=47865 RepID=A0A1C5JSQ9_9ACTN|nr:TetR/AcrR family transcriptional regulator [Micromonospora inositola]SCG73533.1 transcriptional regulator, TetR family [Micromonospora inositola]